MSRKKSYMDKDSLMTEGFFSKIAKMLGLSSSEERKLKKNKRVMNSIKSLNMDVREFEKLASQAFKDIGIDRKIDITKYKLKDFI
tara:strand:+ start:293 stop:547 length:255 start_codon:yes stop_codon:yes gene_type:complete